MSRKRRQRPRLGDRDYEIFDHVMRYRMTTREALHKLFFADSEPNAVTKVTSRLVDHGFLNRYELYPSRSYFALGSKAASFLGLNRKKTLELGPQAKVIEFGIISYCVLSDRLRERLTVRELSERHPELVLGGMENSRYYLDHDGDVARLALMRVHVGASPDYILRKCRDDIATRQRHDAFDQLMNAGRFAIAIVVASEEKAARVREAAARRGDWPVFFRVETVPELRQLVSGISHD